MSHRNHIPQPNQFERNSPSPNSMHVIKQSHLKTEKHTSNPDDLLYSNLDKSYPVESIFVPSKNPENDPEFALSNLGIDLTATEPLLPSVYYVGSDAPMATNGQFPISVNYPQSDDIPNISQKIKYLDDIMLIFLFYVHAGDKLQIEAANELKSRKFKYLADKKYWINSKGKAFDTKLWNFVSLDNMDRLPCYM